MKLEEIIYYNQILKNIVDDKTLKIDPKLKFRFLGMMKEFEPTIANFDIVRNELITQFGKTDEETGSCSIDNDDKEALEKFNTAIQPVISEDVEVKVKKFAPADVFDKGLPANVLLALYPLIETED